ncbi:MULTISPECIES: TetR/AcrR family transcriptional regulator [Streptomyces]|uniref:TetR/AcrR family transcriptional regulator n=1 Tax=Streptomyces TaxID=1883 RepID=UPI000C6344E5|nr:MULTISPECIES: TetR/AcrR family transcriptional regulator [Streptomyces]PIB03821.1 hypothetical protein B1C81_35495 [Streptomyces sp. HG99]
MTDADQPKLRADAARNVRRIVDAAHAVFRRGGLNVPMEEIAAEAGLGIATLYRRFPSKEELVKAVLDQEFNDVIAPALERAQREKDPRKAVGLVMEAGLSFASQEHSGSGRDRTAASIAGDRSFSGVLS